MGRDYSAIIFDAVGVWGHLCLCDKVWEDGQVNASSCICFLSQSILVKVSNIVTLTSKGDELGAEHTLLGKGQEEILVKEGSRKGVSAGLLGTFIQYMWIA